MKDKDGNRLLLGDTGIFLKLKSERRNREIFSSRGGQLKKYVTKNNIFAPKGSGKMYVGFNYNALRLIVVEKLKAKQIIIHIAGRKMFTVDPKEILENGDFLWFKKEGFERQIFFDVTNQCK